MATNISLSDIFLRCICCNKTKTTIKRCNTLNGSQGEATNTDDLNKTLKKLAKGIKKTKLDQLATKAVAAYVGAGAYKTAKPKRSRRKRNAGYSGKGAYAGMGAYSGMGSYVENQLFEGSSVVPQSIRSTKDETNRLIFSKKEYICDIYAPASSAFSTPFSGACNPGLPGMFPWLSQIAANFDMYKPRKVIAHYKPNVSSASTTGQAPSIIMAWVYNATALPFTTKNAMEEYDGCISARAMDNIVCGMECDPRKIGSGWRYTRSGAVSGQDLKTYDASRLFISINGSNTTNYPAGVILGELWLEYEFELAAPKAYDNLGYSIMRDMFAGITGLSGSLPLGSAPTKSSANSIGGAINKVVLTQNGTWYTFPDNISGHFRIQVNIISSAVTGTLGVSTGATSGGQLFWIPPTSATGLLTAPSITQFVDQSETAGGNHSYAGTYATTGVSCWLDVYVGPATSPNANVIIVSFTALTASSATLEVVELNPLTGPIYSGGGLVSNFVAV